jgi:DNA/RNA-binding domain of Phe-tRNA-synthetase-like protein
MTLRVEVSPNLPTLQVGVVEITGASVETASDELQAFCHQVAQDAIVSCQSPTWEQQCHEVRQMLRHGKFKASGRSKPAQEYLLRCVTSDGSLPSINAPVNLLNAISLHCNLPISLLSISKCSDNLWVDRGQAGEQFVFNSAGHAIDLTDLITTYDRSAQPMRPVGTPIKDSMAGKIDSTDRHLVAIVYAPKSDAASVRCRRAVELLASGMLKYCQASDARILNAL